MGPWEPHPFLLLNFLRCWQPNPLPSSAPCVTVTCNVFHIGKNKVKKQQKVVSMIMVWKIGSACWCVDGCLLESEGVWTVLSLFDWEGSLAVLVFFCLSISLCFLFCMFGERRPHFRHDWCGRFYSLLCSTLGFCWWWGSALDSHTWQFLFLLMEIHHGMPWWYSVGTVRCENLVQMPHQAFQSVYKS